MSLPRPRRAIAAVAPVALAAALLAACSSDAEPGPTVDAAAASDGGTADGDAESALLAACGPELTAQLPWWPGVDYAFLFQLIGSDGEIDADENSYSGEIGHTGVTLEIRAGGPAAGFQRPQALVYQDDSIGAVGVEQGVRAMGALELCGADRVGQPPVVRLSGELEHPTRHRHGDPVAGELVHERVEPLPGRFAGSSRFVVIAVC
jgi:hypothetical protein